MKVIISDPSVISKFNEAEAHHSSYVKKSIAAFLGLFLGCLIVNARNQSNGMPFFVGMILFMVFTVAYDFYLESQNPMWHPFKGVTAKELEKSGYKYSHWNKFWKDGQAYFCAYPKRVNNHLEVDIREWTNADNGET